MNLIDELTYGLMYGLIGQISSSSKLFCLDRV